VQRNFERRKVALGDCGRAYGTSCPHEHSCVRCPVLRIDPGQRARLADIRDNLTARIAEAEREGWLGEAEGLRVSLAAARDKLTQLDERACRAATVSLGIPAYRDIAARTAALPGNRSQAPTTVQRPAGYIDTPTAAEDGGSARTRGNVRSRRG